MRSDDPEPAGAVRRWVEAIHHIEDALLALLLATLVLLASAQILLRLVFDVGLAWADPLLRVMVLWLGLLGALAASRGDHQISIDVLTRFLPARTRAGTRALTAAFTAVVSAVVAWHGARFVAMDYEAGSPGVGVLPAWSLELIIPVAFGLIALRYALLAGLRLQELTRGAVADPTEGTG